MLSAESATGQYPFEAVQMMDRIAGSVERDPSYQARIHFTQTRLEPTTADALAGSARQIAQDRLGDSHGLLHQLGSDRSADCARAPAGAAARDQPLASHFTASRTFVGCLCRPYLATLRASKKMVKRASAWRFAIGSRRAATALFWMAGIPFGTAGVDKRASRRPADWRRARAPTRIGDSDFDFPLYSAATAVSNRFFSAIRRKVAERLADHLVHIVIAVGREPADEGDVRGRVRERLVSLEQRLILGPRHRIIRIALGRGYS